VLVAAEKAFEKSCIESGIRNGFLANVDSNGIEFTEKGPADVWMENCAGSDQDLNWLTHDG
jgi:hypothetical protein